ncbi:phosphoribosylaminoimidazole-succinocarboxamide synthase, partial [mine drainage metagenome]
MKEVWEVSPTELEFVFSDDISVFDKRIPNPIPHKGESLARTAAHWFALCAREGVNHHFLRLSAPNRMRVRRVEVVEHPKPSSHPKRQFIPLEFVVRYYVAGSLWDRIQAGKVPAPELGFPGGHTLVYGEKLPQRSSRSPPSSRRWTVCSPSRRPPRWVAPVRHLGGGPCD